MIAWMQYWNSVEVRPIKELPFFGQMTLPRELNVRDGRLIQNPVRELLNYRGSKIVYENISVSEKIALSSVKGRSVDFTVRIKPDKSDSFKSVTVNVAEGKDHSVAVCYCPAAGTVLVDRSRGGWPESVFNQREFAVRDRAGEITLRFILDRYSMELFVNGGEEAASFAIFSPQEADGISFEAEGKAIADIELYTLDI
jgi:beta-fructofuranosidase